MNTERISSPAKELQNIGSQIGRYYLKKNDNNYEATRTEIENLKIVNVQLVDDQIIISTARPGLLIGRKGMNIENLQTYLGKKLSIQEYFSWEDVIIPEYPCEDFDTDGNEIDDYCEFDTYWDDDDYFPKH